MTQIVDKKLKLMCDCCKSHFDKPCAWLSLGNEYCTEIMEIQKELEEKDKEIERLNNIINEANRCILNFLMSEEYIKVDGISIADNYNKLMNILGTPNNYDELKGRNNNE